jgi:hypothetical protein
MPSSSDKQKRFMQAIAHDKDFSKKVGVPQEVGKEFNDADKAKGKDKKKSRLNKMYK